MHCTFLFYVVELFISSFLTNATRFLTEPAFPQGEHFLGAPNWEFLKLLDLKTYEITLHYFWMITHTFKSKYIGKACRCLPPISHSKSLSFGAWCGSQIPSFPNKSVYFLYKYNKSSILYLLSHLKQLFPTARSAAVVWEYIWNPISRSARQITDAHYYFIPRTSALCAITLYILWAF